MRRLRHEWLFMFFFLVLLSHCAQVCLAAGHVHEAATVAASPTHDPKHAPCHSPPACPQRTSDQCPDCGSHFFLRLIPAGTETQAVSGPPLPLFCLLTRLPLSSLAQRGTGISWLHQATAPPLSYLALSILRI